MACSSVSAEDALYEGVLRVYAACGRSGGDAREDADRLLRYIHEIELFNAAYGLVSCSSTEELVIKHILDSLAPLPLLLPLLPAQTKAADLGSGAGFPGIPLAIAFPACRWTLIERGERRAGFLYNVAAVMNLANVTIMQSDIHTMKAGGFDLALCRAFHPLDTKLYKAIKRLLTPEGVLVMYKGRQKSVAMEMSSLPAVRYETFAYAPPFLAEDRRLVLVR